MEKFFRKINTFKFVRLMLLFLLIGVVLNAGYIVFISDNLFSVMLTIHLIFSFIMVIFGIFGIIAINRYSNEISKISNVTKQVASGNFVHRVTNIDKTEEIGKLSWDINNMLDQLETFMRDLESSLKNIKEGKTHRKMMPTGLHGTFAQMSSSINTILSQIATAQSKDAFIQDMLKVIKEYEKGIYLKQIDTTGMQEDIIGLAKGINALGESLSKLSYMNLKNGLTLQKSSEILAKNVNVLSATSSKQASSLEEISVALEEITSTIKNTNQNATKMQEYASEVSDSVSTGLELASKTAVAMDEINEEVNAINESIAVIDQIAFQTNILSLNAAVEAATAGEAGKGFAVVAGEVRNLANRSAEAANEIKTIVSNATIKANNGKELTDKMIHGYNVLNTNIKNTVELIKDVVNASKEQEAGIIQINDAVALVDKGIADSANIANQTNKIAQETNQIANIIVQEAQSKEFKAKETLYNG